MLKRTLACACLAVVSLSSASAAQGPPAPPAPQALDAPQTEAATEEQTPETTAADDAFSSPLHTEPATQEQSSESAPSKLDEILVVLRGINDKIRSPQGESLFTKVRDDYISNMAWEFLGYHRGKGGYLPFIVTLIGFATALLKLWLTFASKRKGPAYVILDVTVSIAFLGLASATLWLMFGGPVISQAVAVDLTPLQEQVHRLQISADQVQASQALANPERILVVLAETTATCRNLLEETRHLQISTDQVQASQALANPERISVVLAETTATCRNLLEETRIEFASTKEQITRIPTSVPGYGCISLLFLLTAIGATAGAWLVGRQKGWW